MSNEKCPSTEAPKQKGALWILTYVNKAEPSYAGIAVVRALDAHDAERTFYSQSEQNAYQQYIKIDKLYLVEDSYESMLLAEQYVKTAEE